MLMGKYFLAGLGEVGFLFVSRCIIKILSHRFRKVTGAVILYPPSSLNICLRVIFKNTVITAPLNKGVWSTWGPQDKHLGNVFFVDYNSSGIGVRGAVRPSFATVLNAREAASYNISSAVGSDYASWVDPAYLV